MKGYKNQLLDYSDFSKTSLRTAISYYDNSTYNFSLVKILYKRNTWDQLKLQRAKTLLKQIY